MERTFDIGGDLTVGRLGFGAMSLADGNVGWPDDPEHMGRVAARAVELGVDLIDTADFYGNGASELIVGAAIDVDREDVVVATKGGALKQPDGTNALLGTPAYLKNAALRSRVRLRADAIDLYQYHKPDPETPIEDAVTALAELRDEGVIRHLGLSNVSVEQLDRARDVAEVATVQNRYSVANRTHEDVLAACERHGIGFIAYSPIAKGRLDGVEGIDEIAAAHDATRYGVALAWLLERSPVLLPIPGTADLDHLAANVAAADIDLAPEEVARLDAADP